MDQEIVAWVDLQPIARADESGGGALLYQQRAVEFAARPEIGTFVDRHVVPAMGGIDPDLALFARLGRRSLRRRRLGRRPVQQSTADHAQRGDAELPAGLDVAEQPLMLGLELLPRRGGIRSEEHTSELQS